MVLGLLRGWLSWDDPVRDANGGGGEGIGMKMGDTKRRQRLRDFKSQPAIDMPPPRVPPLISVNSNLTARCTQKYMYGNRRYLSRW